MYKDVWKKFGAKVFVVLCSILLVGGVAIAAPKLRAANGKISLGSAQFVTLDQVGSAPAPTSGSAIIYLDRTNGDESFEYKTEANGTAADVIPSTLKMKMADGSIETLRYGTDYICTDAERLKTHGVSESAADGYLTIKISSPEAAGASSLIESDNTELSIKYKIKRAELPAASTPYRIQNDAKYQNQDASKVLIVGGVNDSLTSNNIKVYIRPAGSSNDILLPNTEYSIKDKDGLPADLGKNPTAKALGACTVQIHFNNYYVRNMSGGGTSNYATFPFTIKKDAANLGLSALTSDASAASGYSEFKPKRVSDQPDKVEIWDTMDADVGEVNLMDVSPNQFGNPSVTPNAADKKITISVSPEANSNYINSCTKDYYVNQQTLSVKFAQNPGVLDFDTNKGIQINKRELTVTNNDDGSTSPLYPDDYDIIDCKVVKSWADRNSVDGATAGTVEITIQGKDSSDYPGDKGTLTYSVQRSLSDQMAHLKSDKDSGRIEYDGESHELDPKLYFDDAPDKLKYYLAVNTDIDVSYELEKRGTPSPRRTGAKEAGTVYMTVKGKVAQGAAAGYYNTASGDDYQILTYEISPKSVNDYDWSGVQSGYELNGSAPDVAKDITLTLKSGKTGINTVVLKNIKNKSEEYTVDYYWDLSCTKPIYGYEWGDNGSVKAGETYYAKITFTGNFCDDIVVPFQLTTYDHTNVKADLQNGCELDGNDAAAHIYNAEEHRAVVKAQLRDNPDKKLVEGRDFTLEYNYREEPVSRVDVTNKNITVFMKFTGTEEPLYVGAFRIQPRPVDTDSLSMPSSFGTGTDDQGEPIRTHEYSGTGDGNVPNLDTLELTYVINGEERNLTLHKADGDGVNDDYTVEPGLYNENGTKQDLSTISTTKKYYYGIKPQNNFASDMLADGYKRNMTLVGPFRFIERNINSTDYTAVPMDYNKITSANPYDKAAKTWLETAGNLIVTDKDYGVVTSDNYEITITKDNIPEDGTIEFSLAGKGCYTGVKTGLKLEVGTDLASTQVREAETSRWRSFTDREIQLNRDYTKLTDSGDNQYGLNFSSDDNKGDTNLYYGGEDPSNIIKFQAAGSTGGNYKVIRYEDPVRDKDNPQSQMLANVTLQGMNGYYGKVTIYIPIKNVLLNESDYKIVFRGGVTGREGIDYVFDNRYLYPDFDVYKVNKDGSLGDKLPEGAFDKKNAEWVRNFHVTNGWDEKDQKLHWAQVTIKGQFGYSGTLSGWFNIVPRSIEKALEPGVFDYPAFALDEYGKSTLSTIPYTPYTNINGHEHPGAWQNLELYYMTVSDTGASSYKKLEEGNFDFYCTNDETDAAKPKPTAGADRKLVITGKGDFTGKVVLDYTVSPVSIKDCSIEFEGGKKWYLFTGEDIKPNMVVKQTVGTNVYTLKEGEDYNVTPVNATFVSQSWDLEITNSTYVIVSGIEGNYTQEDELAFVVYGMLDPSENLGAYRNSKFKPDPLGHGDAIPVLRYSNPMTYETLGLQLMQKRENMEYDTPDTQPDANNPAGIKNTDQRELQYGEDKDFTVTCSNPVAGTRRIKVFGTGNGVDKGLFVTGAAGVEIPVIIQADLGELDEAVLWEKNNNSPNISLPVTGSAITPEDLASMLYVYCGGREMKYGTDYIFDGRIDSTLGEGKRITLKPTEAAEKAQYLTGEYRLTYNVTSSISNAGDGVNIKKIYVYKHGHKVIDLKNDDFNVIVNGNKLYNGDDYDVTVLDADGNPVAEPKECGNYRWRIQGKGSYGSFITGNFEIVPYDFDADYAQGKVNVVLENEEVTFNGGVTLPKVNSVIVKEGTNNTEYTLKEGDFEVVAGEGGNNDHWTDTSSADNSLYPSVAIQGVGNYTGKMLKKYVILRKDIRDADIEIAPLEGYKYQNGIEIKPYPNITYKDLASEESGKILLALKGIEFKEADAPSYDKWQEWGTHFTYRYLDDVKNAGTGKRIEITGIGNFFGKKTITYDVNPLPLSDTKLTFLSEESPVYDGTEQKPAFKLSYGDIDNILIVRNGEAVSTEYLKDSNVEIKFDNNTNASTEQSPARVIVRMVAGSNANYEGEISKEFTILPAPLENHVRFMYHPKGSNGDVDLKNYKLSFPFIGVGSPVYPKYAPADAELAEEEIGMYYNYPSKANHGKFLVPSADYGSQEDPDGINIEYKYVEPDTDDTDIREEYQRPTPDYAGKVRVTITGKGNYSGKASFWYFIGDDISSDAKISISPTTAVFNSQNQYPTVTISGVDKNKCTIGNYRGEVLVENLITDKDFIDAGTYFIRVEGDPSKGTYATKPETLTFTITPRAFSNSLVIDGFKKEYAYTGYEIRPVGISVTDYIDNIKYRLTEEEDYVLTYSNNLNAGIAYINVKGQGNFSGSASTNFLITSSTISSGGIFGSNSFLDEGSGEISGAVPVAPNNVKLTMDTSDAMYYTGKAVYPKVSISGMTENVDYTVTFSNNVEVGMGVATINGIGNNNGVITKNFRIIAPLSKCTISPIPAQQYTGSAVTPSLTVRCGNTVLMEGTDYTVTYSNNINIGTATATIRALNNANFTGSASVKFSIGNDVGGFIISGFAPSYAYTGNAITPGVVVETGSSTLTLGTDYTVSYSNNVNAGTATITVTGTGKYSGTQTANFIIEAKSIQSCDTTEVTDRTYTGDAYTPDITVSDGGKVLTKGVDYTVTYTNNTNPGTASILIQGMSNNYTGTKVISFKISAVAVKGLKSSSVKYNSLKLAWTKQGYADGYQICNSSSKVVKTVKKNSASITGLSAGKTYKYKVRSYVRNADGTKSYGAFSSVLSVTTKLRTPTVKVVSNAKGQARISWSKVSGASGYEIYYKKSSKAKYKKLKTVNNPNVRVCTVRGMKSGDRAYFRIRAFRKNGSKKVYSALNPLKVITVK